jgi:hypothetical protein
MKKIIAGLLLLSLLPSFLGAQSQADYALSSIQKINLIVQELQGINSEREIYLQELENINSERKQELLERLEELRQREKELLELKLNLELFGSLIDDQATYYRSLQKKLAFWRIFSLALSASTIALLIATIK